MGHRCLHLSQYSWFLEAFYVGSERSVVDMWGPCMSGCRLVNAAANCHMVCCALLQVGNKSDLRHLRSVQTEDAKVWGRAEVDGEG